MTATETTTDTDAVRRPHGSRRTPRSRSARRALLFGPVALAVAALLGGASTAVASAAQPAYQEYVALGDSWSADVNLLDVTSQYVPFGCVQSAADYPHQVAKALGVTTFRDATCGGSTTVDMTQPQSAPLGGTNPPEFDQLTSNTDLVTLGIGGNDVGLVGVIEGCINLLPSITPLPGLSLPAPLGGSCQPKYVTDGVDSVSQAIAATAPKIATVIAGIKARSPHARIELVNYMNPLPTEGCYPYVQVADEDMPWLHAKITEMDTMLATVAAQTHVGLVDTNTGMTGHDVCELPGNQYVTALLPISTDPLIAVPFHPTQLGADHQAAAVLKAVDGAAGDKA
ncbi:MAG TPA: SGNH/GDSL hydrolase family protein [Pseudonocardiaceae bacterium]|jgi:lysophospholipase L1-like esterase|nr:SGNH/GDSL hydrolase family protein [Pseudonocardiaceae bacterium]